MKEEAELAEIKFLLIAYISDKVVRNADKVSDEKNDTTDKVELIDLAGKILMTRAIGRQERTMSFNISNLAAGIYNVKLTGNEKLARKQIIKE